LLIGQNFSLDRYFRKCRYRQPGVFSPDNRDRFASYSSDIIVFGRTPGNLFRSGQKKERILAEANGDGHRLALVKTFLPMNPRMFSR
jgi:hypothetical protein